MHVPFDIPAVTGDELQYIADVNARGLQVGQAEYTQFCESWISARYAGSPVMLTFSGTTALEVIFALLDLAPGDEIILPSYSFPSCANAVLRAGGIPVLADIDTETLGLDPASVLGCLSARTKAILCIHYAGLPCKIDELKQIAAERGVVLIEDCAQAFLSEKNGRMLGTYGNMAMLSFGAKKLLHCGQGGAVIINDARYVARAEVLRDRGTNRAEFLAGRVGEYSWQAAGTSFSPAELNSAYLKAQLLHSAEIVAAARATFTRYADSLRELQAAGLCKLPHIAEGVRHNGSLFYVVTPDRAQRDELIRFLRREQIVAQFHFVPLHMGQGRVLTKTPVPLSVSESVYAGLVRLPVYYSMTRNQLDYVIGKVHSFYNLAG